MLIAIRLKPGRDADLIDWLNSLPEGDRSYHIREALRRQLGGAVKPVTIITSERVEPVSKPARIDSPAGGEDLESNLDRWI